MRPVTILEHASGGKCKKSGFYQYRECGLENIWLVGGFSLKVEGGEEYLDVEDRQELHNAIALSIIHRGNRITGRELWFLRHELGLTQEGLARLLETDVQSVARWEKGRTKTPGPADRCIRLLMLRKLQRDQDVVELLDSLAKLDRLTNEKQFFKRTCSRWEPAA